MKRVRSNLGVAALAGLLTTVLGALSSPSLAAAQTPAFLLDDSTENLRSLDLARGHRGHPGGYYLSQRALFSREQEQAVANLVETAAHTELATLGPASLSMFVLPVDPFGRHVVRDPGDVVSLVGAVDVALGRRTLELYVGLGLGAGSAYRVPAMVVNWTSGIAARMGLGVKLELSPALQVGAGLDAAGLVRRPRDIWATLAEDKELRGATVLPVHAQVRWVL